MFDEVPAHSIAVARAFWFLVMMWEIYSYTEYDYAKTRYQGKCSSMSCWRSVPTAGLFYHYAAFAFAAGFAFLFLQCMSFYLNHFYLVSVLGFAYAFVPANRFWSLDALFGLVKRSPTVPFWTVAMTRIFWCLWSTFTPDMQR
jgi:hypothetical protein